MAKTLTYIYFLVAFIEIISEATGNENPRFFTKPLLMIVLMAFYAQSVGGKCNLVHKVIIAAFAFSWIGDVALMFVSGDNGSGSLMGIPKNPNFFLAGLAGFLITHLLYTIAFVNVTDKKAEALLPKRAWMVIPLFIYMAALLYLLLPSIYENGLTRPFLAPVIVYSTAIAVMVLFAINRHHRVNDKSFLLVFSGALLFMFSDTLIAINKFLNPVPFAGVFIMLLYVGGQYLIARGVLAQFE